MKTSFSLPMMFFFFFLFFLIQAKADKIISVEEAATRNLVQAKVYGSGGHLGNVIRMKVKNLHSRPVSVSIEAGRRLDSENNGEQDMLVTSPVTLALLPNETRTITISGMCCQAHNASPDSGSAFSIGKMADTSLVRLARFIDKNKWHGNSTAQHAVWVVSDDNPMESIGGEDNVSKQLQQFVSKLTGRKMPEYKIEYEQGEHAAAFYARPSKISGTFEYETVSHGLVSFGIYDAQGRAVQIFFTDVPRNKGSYFFEYEFRASDLPSGEYFARLRLDGQIRKEQKFTF